MGLLHTSLPSKATVASGVLLIALGGAGVWFGATGDGLRALQQTNDVLQSFIGRSPGERRGFALLKGKEIPAERADLASLSNDEVPTPQAPGSLFDEPADQSANLDTLQIVLPNFADVSEPPDADRTSDLPSPSFGNAPRGGGVFAGGIVGGTGTGGGGPGGGGPGGGDGILPTPTPTVPGAVPEPSTWALMLLGYAALGALLRRRKDPGSRPRRADQCAGA